MSNISEISWIISGCLLLCVCEWTVFQRTHVSLQHDKLRQPEQSAVERRVVFNFFLLRIFSNTARCLEWIRKGACALDLSASKVAQGPLRRDKIRNKQVTVQPKLVLDWDLGVGRAVRCAFESCLSKTTNNVHKRTKKINNKATLRTQLGCHSGRKQESDVTRTLGRSLKLE